MPILYRYRTEDVAIAVSDSVLALALLGGAQGGPSAQGIAVSVLALLGGAEGGPSAQGIAVSVVAHDGEAQGGPSLAPILPDGG